jgi:heat shock protein HtpX
MWELIQANRRKSIALFISMGILLILLGFFIGSSLDPEAGGYFGVFISLIIWTVLSFISYFAGSKIVLGVSGAREVTKDVHPQLFNVVEEMKIASSLPSMPKIYIINEAAPNAFATGVKPENSAIAVTAGLLTACNRDELQGVIAHEMAHIINRDVLLMTFAGVMLGTIVIISEVFLRGFFYSGGRYKSRSSKSGGQAQIIFLLAAIVFAILAPIMARLLYFAISRKREYLADATAVRLTRYPEGLASALEKISNSNLDLPRANKVTAPMYIINPLKKKGMKISDLTSTHPPISERIRILRGMMQGANFIDYQKSYSKIKGKSENLIPVTALKDSSVVPLRSTSIQPEVPQDLKTTHRTLGDLMMKVHNYSFITCTCGIKIKVPPDFSKPFLFCPRCGTKNEIINRY